MRIRKILASSRLLETAKVGQCLRSAKLPILSLSECVAAKSSGHVPLREFLTGHELKSLGIVAAENILVIISEQERDDHHDVFRHNAKALIELLGVTVVVIPNNHRDDVRVVANLLAPHGNFQLPESAAA